MSDLFTSETNVISEINATAPLAARLRPHDLPGLVGQQHLLGEGRPLARLLEQKHLHSLIFWGPPGTGKTTLAMMLAANVDAELEFLSAVLAGVKDIREAVARAKARRQQGRATVLFVDEVHRFNKAQQDAFLPHVEDGTVVFMGATTENPSFELNNALLSRVRVYRLLPLTSDDLAQLFDRAVKEQELAAFHFDDEARSLLIQAADGDARRLLNLLESCADLLADKTTIASDQLKLVLSDQVRRFDKGGDAFYDQISALHKSVRGSAPDAALYWFTRMLDGGCDPLYLGRRIIRMAWEDIGLADPRAMQIANEAVATYERLGSPEGELALGQAVLYMACAPKSNAGYVAINQMRAWVADHPSDEVPLHLRNAPTKLMKQEGYGAGYHYAHDFPDAFVPGEKYLPEGVEVPSYQPVARGLEMQIAEKLAKLRMLNEQSEWRRYEQDKKTRS
jgi:putative ATPase